MHVWLQHKRDQPGPSFALYFVLWVSMHDNQIPPRQAFGGHRLGQKAVVLQSNLEPL